MKDEIEVDVSKEVGYEPAKISDQIAGKIFPDTPVKRGTRWIYVVLLLLVLGYIVFQTYEALKIIFFS